MQLSVISITAEFTKYNLQSLIHWFINILATAGKWKYYMMHLQQGKRANQLLAFGGVKLFLIWNAGITDVCVFTPSSHVTGKIKKTEF